MTNAYHLAMRPGADTVAALGGLHALAGWPGIVMTDSGGYQAFSLVGRSHRLADGFRFRSHVDGSSHTFTPESVMALHEKLGGDLILPLDVCTPAGASREQALEDSDTTLRWACQSLAALRRDDQLLYGIIQGSVYPDVRRGSAVETVAIGFSAFAIGGVSVGEGKAEMRSAIDAVVPHLPEDAPRHLLGVGEIDDLLACIARGIDTFDCVVPTRWARHGAAITPWGRMNLRNAAFALDTRPIDPSCRCPACLRFGRGALRHFVMAGEMLGLQLLTAHNVHYVLSLVQSAREAILEGDFASFRRRHREAMNAGRPLEDDALVAAAKEAPRAVSGAAG
jgi:queuine tRNA-ribosyltransferase